ncbi:MAG: tyrosine-type recombinase/integrase [Dehalococcoidaceae bacterium]|nr:tyrosine-type recombinase/integrase [Dehalococcoidaceae bacterium]
MKGQVRKRGKSWVAIVPLGKDGQGKLKYKWVTCKTKKEAEAKRAELIHMANTGMLASPKGMLADFVTRWLEDYVKPNLSPRTYEGYLSIFRSRMGPALGNIQLKNLKPEIIQKYYSDMLKAGLSTTSVRHHGMMLHSCLEHAVKWQLLALNPADAVKPPANRYAEMNTLDETGVRVVLEAAEKTPYFALFSLALYSGMRRSELLALRWSDVELENGEVYVSRSLHRLENHETVFRGTKTSKSNRTVALGQTMIEILKQHRDKQMDICTSTGFPFTNDRLVFCHADGKPMLPDSVSQAWVRHAKSLGYSHIRFHDLRHTSATLMLKAGIHPKIVQEKLGHSSIVVTLDLYSHVSPGMQHQAAEKLDAILGKNNSKIIARPFLGEGIH